MTKPRADRFDRQRISDALLSIRKTPKDWTSFEQSIVRFLERAARAPRAVTDGFPAGRSSDGGPGGGAVVKVVDEHGHTVSVAVTSTEAAAFQLLSGKALDDPVADHTVAALGHLAQAVWELNAAFRMVELLNRLDDDTPITLRLCEACKAAGIQIAPEHWGSVGGRLDHNADLCDAHYQYVQNHGDLPTVEQTKHHDRTGRWRTRVA